MPMVFSATNLRREQMKMKKRAILFSLGVLLCFAVQAETYPAAGSGKDSCSSCHTNKTFENQAVFQLINKETQKDVVMGDTAYIHIKKGSSESYKLILGSNGKAKEKAKTIGWMFVFPGGVKTELPNCIRLLNSGQKFRYKKKDKNGKIIEENDNLTVATQTFYFDGNMGNFSETAQGELRTAMGLTGKGNEGLGETILKLKFLTANDAGGSEND